ncbi:RING-H2 finger protein ATL14-like [Impatiens glandulifera]|uniref:RING-H2 finger protein ATL14-like n=1 Tax=Impatiens glandulifera TaxID=253017 RepID=UPI001FB04BDB|nr:RING-H2 finger protein ATL14-like [Impatiens glandulifera]
MPLIISLFLIILFIAAVALFHFAIVGSVRMHRHHFHRRRSSSCYDCYTNGYSEEELRRFLPRFSYVGGRGGGDDNCLHDCPICLDCFNHGDSACDLPDCGHMFHSNCIGKWLTNVASCPLCRGIVCLPSGAGNWRINGEEHPF